MATVIIIVIVSYYGKDIYAPRRRQMVPSGRNYKQLNDMFTRGNT